MSTSRILYITPYTFIKPNAGGKFAMYQQIKHFNKYCFILAVGVEGNADDKELGTQVLPVFKNKPSRYFNPLLIFKLLGLIKSNQINTIIMEHPYMGWLGFALKKLSGAKWFIRSQNIEYLRFKDLGKWWHPILKVYEKWVHQQADGVLCITEEDFNFFKEHGIGSQLINMPFGTEMAANPTDRLNCKHVLQQRYQLNSNTKIILYNGAMNYLPNITGLDIILKEVLPTLQQAQQNFIILICGGGLAASYNELKDYSNIKYCGFVDDIGLYFKGADVFINPVQGGGGIKTKLVDALSYGTLSISSADGAKGLQTKAAGQQLIITPDYNGNAMAEKIIECLNTSSNFDTPKSYYDYYNWDKIIERVLNEIEKNNLN
jgi:polysaccharide biosynthesis protein PslH